MKVPDTSVVVAAFASWHDHHDVADAAIVGARLLSHVAAETLSTLTRLPDPYRVEARPVWDFLAARFPDGWLAPGGDQAERILGRAVERGISGGAIYDALVAGAAAENRATLVSLDRRAERTYRDLGVRYELLA